MITISKSDLIYMLNNWRLFEMIIWVLGKDSHEFSSPGKLVISDRGI